MSLYDLPKFSFSGKFKKILKERNKSNIGILASAIFLSIVFGFLAGAVTSVFFYSQFNNYSTEINLKPFPEIEQSEEAESYQSQISQEAATIRTVKESSPAVVSIVISKDVPIIEEYLEVGPFGVEPKYREKGTEKKEIGGGTGFIVSEDGLILTNKHVVLDEEADYTVFTNDGRKFPAKILAIDPLEDLAVLKIEKENNTFFPVLKLGNSDSLEIGQAVIAIGNALAEFRNTVSTGVISGLGRKITASGGSFIETLEDVIQTDAAINKGNSGGPLLNLKGEVIGINTAMAIDAQSIGFAIPINKAKKDIEQVKSIGKIVYPFLGIRYILINENVKQEYGLLIDYGALIVDGGPGNPAIWPDSAAEKGGLKEGDILLEFNNEKITFENTLAKIIMKYNPGDEVVLKILRGEQEITIKVVLDERSE